MPGSVSTRSPARVLVTGGAGFIGHRTVTELLATDASTEVAIIDNLSVGMPMPDARRRLSTYAIDIRDKAGVVRVIEEFRPDTIIHLAAIHHIPTCERERGYSLDVNVVGTERLLEVSESKGVARFVLASSGAVYDWAEGSLAELSTPLRPRDNYSLAKFANESQLAYWADRTGGFARIARIFNTIGHDDPNAHLVPDIISQISPGAKEAEVLLGNQSPRRDYIHADDTARAIAAIAREEAPSGIDVYNVASGNEASVGELVALLGRVMGVAIRVREDATRKRRVDRPSQLGSTERIEKRVGFKTSKSLRAALEDIVRHLGRQPVESA